MKRKTEKVEQIRVSQQGGRKRRGVRDGYKMVRNSKVREMIQLKRLSDDAEQALK